VKRLCFHIHGSLLPIHEINPALFYLPDQGTEFTDGIERTYEKTLSGF